MIFGFAHPALVVPNLEQAREFYEAMFGFRLLSEEGWSGDDKADRVTGLRGSACSGYMLAGHNCYLELFEFSAPSQCGPSPADLGSHEPGIRHLSFFVDNCADEQRRLLALGGEALGEPVEISEGAHAVYCRDPFGNIIELCNVPDASEDLRRLPGISHLGNYAGT